MIRPVKEKPMKERMSEHTQKETKQNKQQIPRPKAKVRRMGFKWIKWLYEEPKRESTGGLVVDERNGTKCMAIAQYWSCDRISKR